MLKIGDLVTFISKDDWIEYGSKGLITSVGIDLIHQGSYRVKFHTGNAADRDILCEERDLQSYSPDLGLVPTPNTDAFDRWSKDANIQCSESELELLQDAFYAGVKYGRQR